MPSGGVCGVLSLIPRICAAAVSASAGVSASLIPPALPRPPACTCAFTTTRPPMRSAAARASAGVVATSPRGTATPNSRSSALAWYSWIFIGWFARTPGSTDAARGHDHRWARNDAMGVERRRDPGSRRRLGLAAELPQEPDDGIEIVGHALLHRNDAVVGDVDVLGTDLRAALGDVAEPDAGVPAHDLRAVDGVLRVHVQAGRLDEEAWPREGALQLLVVADDVADVLAEETLDALVELLDAIDVLLPHAVLAVGVGRLQAQRRHLLGLLVVVRDVGHEVLDERERLDGRDRDGLALLEEIHPRHAHETRLAVDLGAAGATLSGLAVPAAGEVGRLGGLDPVHDVEHDHARIGLHAILLERPPLRVAAEHPHGRGRHHLRSWNSDFSSSGIWGSGSRLSCILPWRSRTTTFTLPHWSSVYGWSSRV